jgi:UDP-N-acetylmuramoylalanine--D-glutamate ligase
MTAVLDDRNVNTQPTGYKLPQPDLQGKRVLVVGMGISGQAAVNLLLRKGAVVYAYDQNPQKKEEVEKLWIGQSVEFCCGTSNMETIDLCVISPGVPPNVFVVETCRANGVPITGELELATRFISRPVIAVTGTNGKTTVVNMIHHILTRCGYASDLVGNVGTAVSDLILQNKCDGDDPVVMEVSSFQCETIEQFHPVITVITNLAPDHLDRYNTVDEYYAAKFLLTKNQNANEALWISSGVEGNIPGWKKSCVKRFALSEHTVEGLYCVEGSYVMWDGDKCIRHPGSSLSDDLPQKQLNSLAAVGACMSFGVPLDSAVNALHSFNDLPHRLEFVKEVKGIRCYNDSKATNIHAMHAALNSVPSPIRLIAGGRGKGEPLDPVKELIAEKVVAAYLIGEYADLFANAWKDITEIHRESSIEDCVNHALNDGQAGDTLLLSPACASWDMFKNYADRGDRFRQAVKEYPA